MSMPISMSLVRKDILKLFFTILQKIQINTRLYSPYDLGKEKRQIGFNRGPFAKGIEKYSGK